MKFSERMSFVKVDDVIQLESMTQRLHNDIYNYCRHLMDKYFESEVASYPWTTPFDLEQEISLNIQENLYHVAIDEIPNAYTQIMNSLKNGEFYEVYDLLEFLINTYGTDPDNVKKINVILNSDKSGYKFSESGELVPISSNIDLKNISKAIQTEIDNNHLQKALNELSKKNNINLNTVMKESIDAVEIATHKISSQLFGGNPKDSLGRSITILKENNFIENHPAYLTAMSNLYGYSSDGGIRHPKDRDYKVDQAEATFMLEICSAFISMLKFKLVEYQNNHK